VVSGIVGFAPDEGADLGIGHLRPKDLNFLEMPDWTSSPYLEAGWLQATAIPIYVEPNGLHWGWIVNGWLVPNEQPAIALGRDASFSMLHTYYALYSFPVIQVREDGWFEFQYTPVGKAWAHRDHLNLGSIELAIQTWEERFLQVEWVEFLNHGASQPLYANPDSREGIVNLIGPDSYIEPIAFSGDWMQVRVTQPAAACNFLVGATTQEGWIRWRSPEQGILIWYPPQGC
jgi:hypothetical protein